MIQILDFLYLPLLGVEELAFFCPNLGYSITDIARLVEIWAAGPGLPLALALAWTWPPSPLGPGPIGLGPIGLGPSRVGLQGQHWEGLEQDSGKSPRIPWTPKT